MYHLSHKSLLVEKSVARDVSVQQSGFAMVVTLIMLLVLVGMAVSLSYVASIQSSLVSSITGKFISIDVGETCFDNAIEWLTGGTAQSWTNGTGQALDLAQSGGPLYGVTLLSDTIPLGQADNRTLMLRNRASQAQYHSCIVEKAASTTTRGEGYEIGTSNGYGVSNFTYTIRMTAVGDVNLQTTNGIVNPSSWLAQSGRSTLEAVIDYTP